MSADSTPVPDPQPPAARNAEAPAAPASTPPNPSTSSKSRVVAEQRETIRPRKVQPLRSESEPEETADDSLAAIGMHLQRLFGREATPAQPSAPGAAAEPAVTSKNRRFVSRSSNPPAARSPLPAAFETADQDSASAPPKTAGASPNDATAETAVDKTAALAGTDPGSAKASVLPALERPARAVSRGQRRKQRSRARRVAVGAFLALAGVLALSFLMGRASVPKPALSTYSSSGSGMVTPAPKPVLPAWPAAAMAQLDGIIATDRAGEVEDAFAAATALRKQAGGLPGLDLYLGNLQVRLAQLNDANVVTSPLADPLAASTLAAAAYDQMGLIYSRQRNFQAAIDNFSRAAADNPFCGPYYFHWAEALRRRGKPENSLSVFDRALDRLPANMENDTLRQRVAFKSRLAAIEIGQGARFKTEMDEALKSPAPTGYWLLTAAAVALQENRIPDAVDTLQRAKAALPPMYFDNLVSDYFFRGFATSSEPVAALVMVDDSTRKLAQRRAGEYFIDP